MSGLRDYMDATGELPEDVLLGQMTFFTIYDGAYDRDQIKAWFADLSLDEKHIPLPDKPLNAFRKASSDMEDYTYGLAGSDNTAVILVRDLFTDPEQIVRAIVREIRDPKNKRLSHDTIGKATFYRGQVRGGTVKPGSERFKIFADPIRMQPDERPHFDALAKEMYARYNRYLHGLDGMKIRQMVREYLRSLNAVQIKPGSYFVHVTRNSELKRLRTLVGRLGNGCMIELIPLVDLFDQRQLVIKAFQEQSVQELQTLNKEIVELRETRKKVSGAAYAKIRAKYDEVMSRAKEYTTLLDVSLDNTSVEAEKALHLLRGLALGMGGSDDEDDDEQEADSAAA